MVPSQLQHPQSQTAGVVKPKKLKSITVGENAEKLELSNIAGGNVQWCGNFGKQFESSSKC